MKHRFASKALPILLAAIAIVATGCGSNASNNGNSASNGSGNASENNAAAANGGGNTAAPAWTGTINMYAQAYTPDAKNITGIKTDQHKLRELADEYEKAHPGIKIKFVDEEFKDYTQTVRVKAAAGELFDVYWAQWAELNGTFPKGIAEDLTEYFGKPNPYIPDKATWQEAMNGTVVNETAAPGGQHYNINGDYVATAFFYNKELFQQAGIAEAPKTWAELIDASKKLQAAGIVAMSQAPDFGWFQRHFMSDFYSKDFDTIAAFDKAPGISSLDEAVGISKGLLSTKDERFMGWWPMFKQLTDTWKKDYLTGDPGVVGANARNDFLAGKTAIFYDGSWLPNNAADAAVKFEIGSFNFPVLTAGDTPLSTGIDASGAVGGPNGAFQFAVATKEADKSMKEPGKKEAVIDWLQFVGTPEHVEQAVNENGNFVPTWPGTKPNDSMKELASQASKELKAIGVGNSSANLGKDLQRTFGLYLSGNMDLDKATANVQKALDAANKDYATKNDTDYSKY
ncbi:ABC transporter substrate-binding protein [Paenibacillus sacheonensis]|uniref:Extracellular solute-binding protein n=1 Tax=Paenibacillus sacheonensis TaxID=742054 RepID=A0A7X5C0V6_9BACL|nr:extracellular solute-binding protein [Paenibacillus sacheonensis]MBM7567740.1 raffinose/stachyose/melibiose transport system substrate-binding protein [Paenibacillus sacheonensis]NBC71986.1 extracellular solute-binding protein [Paenibacillus sacheonensis]